MNPQTAPAVPGPEQSPEQVIAAAPAGPKGHPLGFYFIFLGEFAERCSYYGMRAILPLYLTQVMLFEDGKASEVYSYFKAACYFLPLLGGWLADRFFGKYWTIVGFSVPYVLGHFVLGWQTQTCLFIALILLACGSGVIKPNISTLMGQTYDQKRPGQESLRSSAFLWFYFAINVGATISQFFLPWIRDYVVNTYHDRPMAYRIAFQFPAWLMVAALAAFALGKRFYAVEVIDRRRVPTPREREQQRKALTSLLGIFALMVFFWVAYEQNDNLWTFFARDHVDCTLDLGFWKHTFPPDGFQFINSALIIVMVPLLGLFFRKVDPEVKRFTPTRKILFGFLCTAAAAGVMSVASVQASGGERVSAWWMVGGYFVLTVGEIFLYGTGLELAYTAAPANMKGFITACFLVTNTLGNLINSRLSPLYNSKLPPAQFFALTACIVLVASIAFYFVGKRFDRGRRASLEDARS